MYWINDVQNAIYFVEENLLEDLSVEEIAKRANSSNANFQRIFSMVTGMTIGEYIRCRRLTLAGEELAENDVKVIDVAFKYGYDSIEGFSRAFKRFHQVSPSAAKSQLSILRKFYPMSIKVVVRGGFSREEERKEILKKQRHGPHIAEPCPSGYRFSFEFLRSWNTVLKYTFHSNLPL